MSILSCRGTGNFKPNKGFFKILNEGLKYSEVLTIEATAKLLGRLRIEESVKYLKESFLSKKTLAVKIAMIEALKSIKTKEALNFIKELASDIKNKESIDVFKDYL
ncbi:MAG: HEAT repeat domain-containing protein [Thermodesulfovibrio sp.]